MDRASGRLFALVTRLSARLQPRKRIASFAGEAGQADEASFSRYERNGELFEDMRVFAVDWSGASRRAERSIWLAEAGRRGLRLLENGRTREELADFLIAAKRAGEPMVVGLDFAFSLPAWFVRAQAGSAPALWAQLASGKAEAWLASCEPPFWGRRGSFKPRDRELFRGTEKLSLGSISPKSAFQIGGAGAVGTGSLRGMALLPRLRAAGFAIWPFTRPGPHTLVEIYPRLFTGPVVKSSPAARRRELENRFPDLEPDFLERAAGSEDAFDAAVSALVMRAESIASQELEPATDARTALEGAIWKPAGAVESDRI